MLKAKVLLSFLAILLTLPFSIFAQSYTGINWYFGNGSNGIRFSRSDGSATLVTTHAALGVGGSAVASDAINGDLLFYTNGVTIFDRNHAQIATGLLGNTAGNQPVVIAKVPGQDDQYYVTTNSANGTTAGAVNYQIVDMSLGGGSPPVGGLLPGGNVSIPGLTTSEAMMVVPHEDGDRFWLITHASGTADYFVTEFTPSGPVLPPTAFNGLGLIQYATNFSYHAGTGRIAVSPHEAARDVEILTFNPTTGDLTFQQSVPNSGVVSSTNPAAYDTEWSANGQYLYISRTGEAGIPADVLQFDINNPSTTLASILPAAPPIVNSYGLQMAPDSTIYHIYQTTLGGPFLVGQISDTDSVSNLVQYTPNFFGQPFGGKQFSSFAPKDSVDINISFTSQGTCANAPTAFFPTVSPGADSLVWNFGDGGGSSEWSPVYTYEQGGTYDVSVLAYLNGQVDSASNQVTITNFDTQITLVQDTTACSCELPYSKKTNPPSPPPAPCNPARQFSVTAQVNGSGSPQLQWFGPDGLLQNQTTATLTPDSAGYYYLVATDTQTGCTTYAGVNIKEYEVQDQRANIWYFGNQAGLDFNPLPEDPVKAITNSVMNAPEGTATISDRNGQVIFFTDGNNLWDRDEALIDTGLGGDPQSTQSALIIPVPGDETLYYIFTTTPVEQGIYEVRYSLFDLRTQTLLQKNVLLFSRSTERLTGNANWLIAHEYGNNSFRAYQITAQGISNPVISSIGSDHNYSPDQNGRGYMKLGSQNMLAVALSTPTVSNVVEIFDFTDSTGVISNFRTANLNNPNGTVYGVEFSPGGNKLYATLQTGATSQLVEFAFDTLKIPYLKKPPIAPVNESLGAIQAGPDGQLYVAANGQQYLKVINVVEDTTQVSSFRPDFPLLNGSTSTHGLPNFIQTIIDPIQGPGLSITGLCLGDTSQFSASGKDSNIDKFHYDFGDGTPVMRDAGPQVTHVYAAAGTYTVKVTVTNQCETYPLPDQQITINNPPIDPSTDNIDLCEGEIKLLDANPSNVPGLTYLWATGETTETYPADRQGTYRVTITNASGCTTVGNFDVDDNRPPLELGPDLTVCEDVTVPDLNAGNPGSTITWTRNNVVVGSSSRQPVNTSVAGIFEYAVTVDNGQCISQDTVTYTINPAPVITPIPPNTTAPTLCTSADGSMSFTISSPNAGALLSYSVLGPPPSPPVTGSNQPSGTLVATGPVLGAGTFGITVVDQVSSCFNVETAIINSGTLSATAAQSGTCDPLRIVITPDAGTAPSSFPISFRVINASTAAVVDPGGLIPSTTPVITAVGLPSGNYVVELTGDDGCRFSVPVTLAQDPPVQVTFTPDICNTNTIAVVTNPVVSSINWTQSDAGSLANPALTTTSVPLTTTAGTYQIKVITAAPANFCPGIDSTTVTIDNFTPEFAQSDPCQEQVTLTATPAGAYTYRWIRNGAFISGGRSITITSGDDGSDYAVEVMSTANGCRKTSTPAVEVSVKGPLTVSLTTTPPCEGSPFTLTATTNQPASYQWSLDGALISGEIASTLEETRAGTYTVRASTATCNATANIEIDLAPVTAGLLRDEAFICPDPANPNPETRQVVLDPGDFASYDWFKDGTSLSWTDPTYSAAEPGVFSVRLINAFGCETTDKTEVIEECDPVIVGPNAFRPTSNVTGLGGDKVNQSFRLFTFFIDDEDFQVFIFNRWGEMIFQSPERDFKWNGGYNNNLGQILPPGTYSYVVRYKSSYRPEEGIQEKRGGVVLLR